MVRLARLALCVAEHGILERARSAQLLPRNEKEIAHGQLVLVDKLLLLLDRVGADADDLRLGRLERLLLWRDPMGGVGDLFRVPWFWYIRFAS